MATKAEVRDMAAGLLGRHRLGQAINDALKIRLDQAYDYVYADLKDEQLTIWASAANSTIPNGVAPHVASLMAFDATSDVGVSQERFERILIKRNIAKPMIRKIVTPIYESLDESEDF
jgi:hypothetical protein|tara:strand:- start:3410 stop:3763 length:354 start_codon:yes stop_codon:yes gene_type:complete